MQPTVNQTIPSIIIIGYSGHAYVAIDCFLSQGIKIEGYCEQKAKEYNPYQLNFLGQETQKTTIDLLKKHGCFVGIGDNQVRKKIMLKLEAHELLFCNAIHQTSYVSSYTRIGEGVLIGAKAVINPMTTIGHGVICNTGSIIEHECYLENFCHIAPNATLCGNVYVGESSFIGAGAVVKQGIKIGKNVVVGAGAVIIRDVPDGVTVVGNPQRILS
jgi:acetyltransferase EpsM